MAYQTKQRDPLFDSSMQAAIERRSKELIGISIMGAGLALVALMISFVPDDATWLAATDQPVQNWLGRSGATVAMVLFIVLGLGAWALPVMLLAWGLRFILQVGHERLLGRAILAIAVVFLASAYAASLGPPTPWTGEFGRGGAFGDTLLGFLVIVSPIQSAAGVKLIAFLLGVSILALAPFAMGCTWNDLSKAGRFLLIGLVRVYGSVMTGMG
ncbi:MAG: DNA translocase FtsK 4TM domain-containing protein, partial [Pseudomonadota bacterium]